MKFGKSLVQVIELSDPEWSLFWIDYKFLKGKIKDITAYREQLETSNSKEQRTVEEQRKKLCESAQEVEFFRCLKKELKKVSAFFSASETLCNIRRGRLWDGLAMLKRKQEYHQDHAAWTRMLAACIRFYKDVLFLENYAIMNYCGFSKILKKHDKRTGFCTRDAYLTKVIGQEQFTKYPFIKQQLQEVETMFEEIQSINKFCGDAPLSDEEQLFIDAIRDLNYQAAQIKSDENSTSVRSSMEQAQTVSSVQYNPGHPPVTAGGGGSSSSAAAHLPEETEAANALLEASLRAKVLDPSPNMPAILSWMQSLSSAGASTAVAHYGPIAAAVRYEHFNGENDKQENSTYSADHSGHTSHGSSGSHSSRDGSSSGISHKTHHKSDHKMHAFRGGSDESMSNSKGASSASDSHNRHHKMSPKGMNDHIMTTTRGDSESSITSTDDSDGVDNEDVERDVHVNKKMRTENHTEPVAAHITRW